MPATANWTTYGVNPLQVKVVDGSAKNEVAGVTDERRDFVFSHFNDVVIANRRIVSVAKGQVSGTVGNVGFRVLSEVGERVAEPPEVFYVTVDTSPVWGAPVTIVDDDVTIALSSSSSNSSFAGFAESDIPQPVTVTARFFACGSFGDSYGYGGECECEVVFG